jgi:carbon storage regulator
MLVLTRREGQGVILNDSVVVVVLESNNGRVRVGLEAPDEVRILRTEARGSLLARREEGPPPEDSPPSELGQAGGGCQSLPGLSGGEIGV